MIIILINYFKYFKINYLFMYFNSLKYFIKDFNYIFLIIIIIHMFNLVYINLFQDFTNFN
jgi:hypothetical protein